MKIPEENASSGILRYGNAGVDCGCSNEEGEVKVMHVIEEMDDCKIDTELQLALTLSPAEREKSLDLDVGYDKAFREWELIVKYSGDLEGIGRDLSAIVTPLLNEYAIIRIREDRISELVEYPEIEFVEKPKGLVLEEMEGIRASCISALRYPPDRLTGRGVLLAVIDSGIDYSHPDFRRTGGATRIQAIWDQTIPGNPPQPYNIGSVYTAGDINRALQTDNRMEQQRIVPTTDLSGHGTHVAGIAAGNGRASGGFYTGVAPDAELLIVRLAQAQPGSFPRTSELMQAIDWVVRYALERRLPLAVNLSYGNNYGNHRGGSLLEQYIDDVANLGRSILAAGAGNEGNTGRHASGILPSGNRRQTQPTEVEFTVSPYESGLNIQLWKNYADEMEVAVRTPSGILAGPFGSRQGRQSVTIGNTDIAVLYGQPTPYSAAQEIYIALIPTKDYIEDGLWAILLYPKDIRYGEYALWLPVAGATNDRTMFLQPSPDLSLTIPSTASRAITVGAYDSRTDSYAAFSGRGDMTDRKPDLVAPGVGITAAAPGGGYDTKSGTSMAAPFVSGGAALLMEWGIIQGNDPFLYGEKLKAYLIRGARRLPGYPVYPNEQMGWGALCVARSLPTK